MDTTAKYRRIIEKILKEYVSIPNAYGDIKEHVVFDHVNDHYLIVDEGWDKQGRIHGCTVHLQIINGKIWIQYDGTEAGIATDLEREGIPKEHIVLAFHRPEIRKHTEYAAA